MRACKNTAFRSGFFALLLRTDESARVYAPAERCYCYWQHYHDHDLFFHPYTTYTATTPAIAVLCILL